MGHGIRKSLQEADKLRASHVSVIKYIGNVSGPWRRYALY